MTLTDIAIYAVASLVVLLPILCLGSLPWLWITIRRDKRETLWYEFGHIRHELAMLALEHYWHKEYCPYFKKYQCYFVRLKTIEAAAYPLAYSRLPVLWFTYKAQRSRLSQSLQSLRDSPPETSREIADIMIRSLDNFLKLLHGNSWLSRIYLRFHAKFSGRSSGLEVGEIGRLSHLCIEKYKATLLLFPENMSTQ